MCDEVRGAEQEIAFEIVDHLRNHTADAPASFCGTWRRPPGPKGADARRDIGSFCSLSSDEHPYFRHRIEGLAFHWAGAHLLVAYALQDSRLRSGFLGYLGAAVRGAKGDSRTEFDRRMGQTTEALEVAWRRWVAEQLAALPL